jgi:hypothetical protein
VRSSALEAKDNGSEKSALISFRDGDEGRKFFSQT